MKTPLRVLIVEDSEFDALLMVSVLRGANYDVTHERVETEGAMRRSLGAHEWDAILADYNLPQFSAPAALKVLQDTGLDMPFIIISGGIGEDTAVAAMKAGAHDYLMKGSLARLAPAVERELREAATRKARRVAEEAVRESEKRYRSLWDTAPDGIVVITTDGRILFANPAVEKIFGRPPAAVEGQNITCLQPERFRQQQRNRLSRFLALGSRRVHGRAMETTGVRADGVEIHIEVSFGEMDWKGQRTFVGFIRDISERKQAEKELRKNEEQFRVAREIQERLFPKSAPTYPGLEIAGLTHSAAAAAGDYFDYLPMLNGCLGIVVGDVTGHGIGPALLMAETRAYLRVLARNREDPGEILTRVNLVMSEDVGSERFVTLMLGKLDPRNRLLHYASAGHPPCYHLSAEGRVKNLLRRTGVALGMLPNVQFTSSSPVSLVAGDLLLFVTDGIEEANSPGNEFFGTERIVQVLREHHQEPAKEILGALCQAVWQFMGPEPQSDDLTAVVVKVL